MKILAIKGGGVRGLLAARLGSRLERRLPGWDDADLLAGTSTGAILALGRAAGFPWKEIVKLYRRCARVVFKKELATVGAEGSFYSGQALEDVLHEAFGDRTLADLEKDVLVPAFSTSGGKPRPLFFTRQRDGRLRVVDVVLASSAAPVYLPPHLGCFDGGLIANDPSVAALVHAAGGWSRLVLGGVIGDLSVFTLGCGRARAPRGLLEAFSEGGLYGPIAGAIRLLGKQHYELDADGIDIPLDGGEDLGESLAELSAIAGEVELDDALDWLEDNGWGS